MTPLNINVLVQIAGPPTSKAQNAIFAGWAPVLTPYLTKYEINTPLRIAHFLAQCAKESDGFRTMEEYATGGAYEGRKDLGNTLPGDGVRYKGRGPIGLTGRGNYKRVGDILGIDLINNPERAAEPAVGLLTACEFWKEKNINPVADRDNVISVTHLVNGGENGLADRKMYLARAKLAVQAAAAGTIAQPFSSSTPTLHRGLSSEAVGSLQQMLSFLGWPVAIDRDFGPGTETAVKGVQITFGLTSDGIVGPKTWAAIQDAVLKRTGARGAAVPAKT